MRGCFRDKPGHTGGRRHLRAAFPLLLLVLFAPGLAHAAGAAPAPANPAAVIAQLFKTPDASRSLLAPNLAGTAATRLAAVAQQLDSRLGAVDGVDYIAVNGQYRIRFAKALVFVTAGFDPQMRLTSFRILREAPRLRSLSQGERLVAGLGDKTAFLIEKNGKDLVAVGADTPLAVGSAFKLSVINALADAVRAGRLSWSQVVPLRVKWRTLPTGILQTWPANVPVTVETLAGLMISLSDNTAADAVMDLVGRPAIEKYAYGNTPILTPGEYFVLSSDQEAAVRQRFLAAAPAERTTILQSIASDPVPQVGEIGGVSPSPLEWHYTARQLCTLIERVHALPVMQINPGVAAPSDWSEIAFKGGSDHGVFNVTTRLTPASGPPYCLSVTLNSAHALNDTRIVSVLTGLVFFLHDKSP
ncbi:MAG: serine hydrolase [Stellaceae bacterium]